MAKTPTTATESIGGVAPVLAEITDKVLYGQIWKRPGLNPRDHSLITLASLVSLYRVNELPHHVRRALANGVTRDEIVEMITHLAFYAGFPNANAAVRIVRAIFSELDAAKA